MLKYFQVVSAATRSSRQYLCDTCEPTSAHRTTPKKALHPTLYEARERKGRWGDDVNMLVVKLLQAIWIGSWLHVCKILLLTVNQH